MMSGSLTLTASVHPCPVEGCGTLISRNLLMCIRHWSKLPLDIRREVHAGNREMKAGGSARRWVDARRVAIEHFVNTGDLFGEATQ